MSCERFGRELIVHWMKFALPEIFILLTFNVDLGFRCNSFLIHGESNNQLIQSEDQLELRGGAYELLLIKDVVSRLDDILTYT